MVAKNDEVHKNLRDQLKKHTTDRKYITLVVNDMKDDFGTINLPIGRSNKKKNKNFSFSTEEDSKNLKDSITHYKLLKRYEYKNKKYSLLECTLETGIDLYI
jgi:23S rRNA pseudouridine1911/1915/1917 synthase